MNEELNRSSAIFKAEIQTVLQILEERQVPAELFPLKDWLLTFFQGILGELEKINYYISLHDEEIDRDIFDRFSWLSYRVQVFSEKFLPGIYRNHKNDVVSLKLLNWLHSQHEQTQGRPFLIMDGDFAIIPEVGVPICYYLPIVNQQSLLFLPLFFHEIGHYLYQCHRQEMDDLVIALQKRLAGHMVLPFQANSIQHKEESEKVKVIVETWYEWAQEFFCDAVGLHIGGKAYLKAFSYYLRMNGRSSYFLPEKHLANSGHPISWLRIRFLAERARAMGLSSEADEIEAVWAKIAFSLGIKEKHFAYYKKEYHGDIWQTIDDMLVEASPVSYKDYLAADTNWEVNFIGLLHEAWEQFEANPAAYGQWERNQLQMLREAPEPIEQV